MANNEQKSALNIVMGAMTFGAAGNEGARVHDIKEVEAILDVFRAHGHTEIDTARLYANGTSEEYLGKIDLASKGLRVETKLHPLKVDIPGLSSGVISHTAEGIREHMGKSLKALNTDTLEIWYLHGPDRSIPYEVTLKAVNDIYKEGKFRRFGISNYMSWEVAEIVGICKANGYIQPTVYQGIYNAIHRRVEPELLPCLRKFGISFYEYNPLAGGIFTGQYTAIDDHVEQGSRFDPNRFLGQGYRQRYWKEPYFKALAAIKEVGDKYNLTMSEVALRWLSHHSMLQRRYGDSIIVGASSLNHIEQNLLDLEKGPLPREVVEVLDSAWFGVQSYSTNYWY